MYKIILNILSAQSDWYKWLQNSFQKPNLALFVILLVIILFFISLGLVFITLYLRLKNIKKEEKAEKLREKWRKILFDILYDQKEPESFISSIDETEKQFFLNFLFQYSLRLKGEELNLLTKLANPFRKHLFDQLKTGTKETKLKALTIAYKLKLSGLKPYLDRLIDSSFVPLSFLALKILSETGKPDNILKFIERLSRFNRWNRHSLTNILIRGGKEVIPTLREKLTDSTIDNRTKVIIVDTLRKLNDYHSSKIAAHIIQDENDTDLLAACFRLISKLGMPEQREVVLPYLESNDKVLKASAIDALGTIGNDSDIELIKDTFYDSDNWVSIHAARALGRQGRIDILKKLAQLENEKAQIAKQILGEIDN